MTVHHGPVQCNTVAGASDVGTYAINSMPTMIATGVPASSTIYSTTGSYVYTNGTTQGIDYSAAGRSSLEVSGDATVHGDIVVNGQKLSDIFNSIESRLAILHPNEQLEEQWDNLRGLREAYVELEREIIEKEKMWSKLKATSKSSL